MKITTAESLIMDILWRAEQPLAIEDLQAGLADAAWTDATIRTLLTRLVRKKAVAAAKESLPTLINVQAIKDFRDASKYPPGALWGGAEPNVAGGMH